MVGEREEGREWGEGGSCVGGFDLGRGKCKKDKGCLICGLHRKVQGIGESIP